MNAGNRTQALCKSSFILLSYVFQSPPFLLTDSLPFFPGLFSLSWNAQTLGLEYVNYANTCVWKAKICLWDRAHGLCLSSLGYSIPWNIFQFHHFFFKWVILVFFMAKKIPLYLSCCVFLLLVCSGRGIGLLRRVSYFFNSFPTHGLFIKKRLPPVLSSCNDPSVIHPSHHPRNKIQTKDIWFGYVLTL